MPISIEDFNNQFLIHIRGLARPHIDETGTIPADVGINIICKANNRVQFFEHHFNDQQEVDSSTDQQLVELAWSALKPDINTWASSVVSQGNLINSTYTPTSSFNNTYGNLNLTSFNVAFNTVISRFEVYPKHEPNSWCVGFSVRNTSTNENFSTDTRVHVTTFAIIKSEQDILDDAWDNLKNSIGDWASSKIGMSNLINTQFIPTSF